VHPIEDPVLAKQYDSKITPLSPDDISVTLSFTLNSGVMVDSIDGLAVTDVSVKPSNATAIVNFFII
tara:strand:- start:932 stop:1132 length:201 start_codon:yes stop_codon:yes gene_type:complete